MFSRSAKPIQLSPDPFGPLRAWLPDPRHLGNSKCRVGYRRLERMLSREEFLLRSRAALPPPEWIQQHIINRLPDPACTETGRWPDQTTITSAINLGIAIVLQNDVRQPGLVQPHVHLAATLIREVCTTIPLLMPCSGGSPGCSTQRAFWPPARMHSLSFPRHACGTRCT
jgi:hypothetical protein